ncbi:ATP-binding protein [Streptomyces griseocarneus]|nr:ATP-binding protein [Streptomyces griseocarneus]
MPTCSTHLCERSAQGHSEGASRSVARLSLIVGGWRARGCRLGRKGAPAMHAVPSQRRERPKDENDGDPAAAVTDRSLHFSVPTIPGAAPAARREVAAQLGLWGLRPGADVTETAVLAVSELVTNTVRHAARASARADVHLGIDRRHLMVTVHDRDPRMPRRRKVPNLDGTGGWGLHLVETLTAEVGGRTSIPRDADGGGKTVTVLLPL